MYQQHTMYVTEIKETYFEIYTKQVSCLGFPLLNISRLPTSIKIPVTIWQIVYIYMTAIITKFDFVNFAFANLVVAWL